MSGKYLRKRVPGVAQDPTMTHVDDPQVFHVGEYIQGHRGLYRITDIEDARFGNPDIRFAHIEKVSAPIAGSIVHDVRENEIETFPYGAVTSDGRLITKEQARAFLEALHD